MADGVGRPSPMDKEENREQLAEMYASGAKRQEMADVFGVHPDVVTRWVKQPRIQALITEKIRARSNRILRRIDSELEKRLEHPDKIDTKDMLAIRRELVPQRVEVGRAGDFDAQAEMAAWAALDAGQELPALPPGEDDGATD